MVHSSEGGTFLGKLMSPVGRLHPPPRCAVLEEFRLEGRCDGGADIRTLPKVPSRPFVATRPHGTKTHF